MTYWETLGFPFVHDDLVFIKLNPDITKLFDFKSIFLKPHLADFKTSPINTYYRPLLEWIYRLQFHFFEFNPLYYHAFNLVLHALNGFLIFCILSFVFETHFFPLAVAIVFLIHPIQSEAVACIAGVSNLLYGFFFLASLWIFIRFTQATKAGFRLFLGSLVLLLIAAGIFVKEQAIMIPAMLVLFYFCFVYTRDKSLIRKNDSLALPLEYLFLFGGSVVVLVFYFVIKRMIFGHFLLPPSLDQGEFALRLIAIPKTLVMYLGLLVFPFRLHYFRTIDILEFSTYPILILSLILFLGCLGYKKLEGPRQRIALFGLFWFLLCLLPVLNFAPLVIEYSYLAAFEHFLYLPLIGFFIFVFCLIEGILYRKNTFRNKYIILFLVFALALTSLLLTKRQNKQWKSEIKLFERVLRFGNPLARVYLLLGKAYYFNAQYDKATSAYERSRHIMERYVLRSTDSGAQDFYRKILVEINSDLGYCYYNRNLMQNALVSFRRAQEIEPRSSGIHNALGLVFMKMNRFEEALFYFKEAGQLNPEDLKAKNNWAVCLISLNRYGDAVQVLHSILAQDPQNRIAKRNFDLLEKEIGD